MEDGTAPFADTAKAYKKTVQIMILVSDIQPCLLKKIFKTADGESEVHTEEKTEKGV